MRVVFRWIRGLWSRCCWTFVQPDINNNKPLVSSVFLHLCTAGQLSAKNIGASLTPGIPTCKQFSSLFLIWEGETSKKKDQECRERRCTFVNLTVSTVRVKLLRMFSAVTVSSQWNVGCTHQTLGVGGKIPFSTTVRGGLEVQEHWSAVLCSSELALCCERYHSVKFYSWFRFGALIIPNMVKVSFLLSVNKLDEIQLFLHGLDLGYLTDIMAVSALSRACFIDNGRCNVFLC